jgi:protein-disulfide isomerase
LVLAVAVGGGVMLYRSSTAPVNRATNKPPATPDNRAANAPIGAVPPNMLGSPTAAVTVEEFADFQCPMCATKYTVAKEIISTYGNRIKFIFRNYPLPMHDKSYEAAVAAEAAGMQGKFWDMENQLFTNQKDWSSATDYRQIWESYAQKIGLDVEKFKNDMAGTAAKSRVDNDKARGAGIGINSTPSFFINNKLVPLEQLDAGAMKALIDAELAKAAGANQSNSAPTTSNSANNK